MEVSVFIAGKLFPWLDLPMYIGTYAPTDTGHYRTTEWLMLKETSEDHLSQPPSSGQGQLQQVAQVLSFLLPLSASKRWKRDLH